MHTLTPIHPDQAVTLDGLFRLRVARSPEAVAYREFDRGAGHWADTTWAEAAAQVARWQAALAAEALAPGERVALALRNGRDWVWFDQAALGLGLVVVPLYPDDRGDSVHFIVEDAQVRLLLVQDAGRWRRLAPALRGAQWLRRVVLLEGEAEAQVDPRAVAAAQWLPPRGGGLALRDGQAEELATIVYTSGTTGRSKGVMLSHRNILSNAYAGLARFPFTDHDLFLSFLPLAHALERTAGYYLPMMAGVTVAYARSVQQLGQDLPLVRPTMLIAVPRIFETVYARLHRQLATRGPLLRLLYALTCRVGRQRFEADQGRRRRAPARLLWSLLDRLVARPVRATLGGRLRLAVSGGAALPQVVAGELIGLGLTICQGYGLTEASPVVSVNLPQDNDPASVGPPLEGVEVRLGADHELLVRGPGVMRGYWNRPDATAEAIDPEGWLHTGDQARIEGGRIHITGRIKDILVLSNGEKVPPGDMETAIGLDPLFDQVLVVGEGRPFLSALLVLNPELWQEMARTLDLDPQAAASLADRRVRRLLLERVGRRLGAFPGYAKVRRIHPDLEPWSVDNDLLTPTLKVRRNAVLARYGEAIEAIYRE